MLNHNILRTILLKLNSQTWYNAQLASSYFHVCYKNEEKRRYKEAKLSFAGVELFDINNIKIGEKIIIISEYINEYIIDLIVYIVKNIGYKYDKIIYLSYFNNLSIIVQNLFNKLDITHIYVKIFIIEIFMVIIFMT